MAGEQTQKSEQSSDDHSFSCNRLFCELRAGGCVAAETVRVEGFQGTVIRGKGGLIESDEPHHGFTWEENEYSKEIAHRCRER